MLQIVIVNLFINTELKWHIFMQYEQNCKVVLTHLNT